MLIDDNLIINVPLQGITVGEADGATIPNNTLVQSVSSAGKYPRKRSWIPMTLLADWLWNVQVENNIVGDARGFVGRSGWTVSGNLVVQNCSRPRPNHSVVVFANWSPEASIDSRSYRLAAGVPRVGARWRPD